MRRAPSIIIVVLFGLIMSSVSAASAEGSKKVGDGTQGSVRDSSQLAEPALVILPDGQRIRSFEASVSAVRRLGGEVLLQYPPEAFIAMLLPNSENKLLALAPGSRIEHGRLALSETTRTGIMAATAIRTWNDFYVDQSGPATSSDSEAPVPKMPDSDALVAPPESTSRSMAPADSVAPSSRQTSEFMAGTVVATVVFVESNGGTGSCTPADAQMEDWDSNRQASVLSEISDGLAFWGSRALKPGLGFIIDNQGVRTTSCEPISRPSGDQSLWIADTLTAMGLPSTPSNYFANSRTFAHNRRLAYGADWAYTIFVVDSLNDSDGNFSNGRFAYAYLNGPFTVLTYDNNGWGISRMNLVLAHETGHIFGALDEYASSNCSTSDTWGYLNVANASCNNGGITSDISIMGEASELVQSDLDVSVSARSALGWRNPAAGVGSGSVVDVVRTSIVSIGAYSPDPTSDTTPTYFGTAGNSPYPPGGCNTRGGVCRRFPSAVSISRIAHVEWSVDGGPFSSSNLAADDGSFDEESEAFSFTPPSPVSDGTHTFSARSVNNFGYPSQAANDTLSIGFMLAITKAGGGSGSITSSPPGISCGGDCSEVFASGTTVALSAAPASDSSLTGWSGHCGGTENPYVITMDEPKACIATFKLIADLLVTVSDSPDPVAVGELLTYSVTATNQGPGSSSGVSVKDTIPSSVTFVSAAPSQGTCKTKDKKNDSSPAKVICDLGTLTSGASATITINVMPNTAGTITNSAVISSSSTVEPSGGSANNKASSTTTVSS